MSSQEDLNKINEVLGQACEKIHDRFKLFHWGGEEGTFFSPHTQNLQTVFDSNKKTESNEKTKRNEKTSLLRAFNDIRNRPKDSSCVKDPVYFKCWKDTLHWATIVGLDVSNIERVQKHFDPEDETEKKNRERMLTICEADAFAVLEIASTMDQKQK